MKRVPVTLQAVRPVPQPAASTLPLGHDFQGMLLRLLLENAEYGRALAAHIKPIYFQNEALAWAWGIALQYRERYTALPTLAYVLDQTRTLNPSVLPIYSAVLDMVRQKPVTDEAAIRDQTLDFIKRQIFRQSFIDGRDLFQSDNVDAAYDLVQRGLDELSRVQFETPDRQWLYAEFADRHIERQRVMAEGSYYTGTGLPDVDRLLGGGAYPGFCGCFLAHPKAGKTTLLTNIGAVAARAYLRKVLHVVLEGSGKQIADRYDTIFTEELYQNVRAGEIDASKYALAFREMESIRGNCVLRAFTDKWDHDVTDIWTEMRELERLHGWEPEVIVLDYVDLLRGRPKAGGYSTPTENHKAASEDVKTLANRGYALWTVSQVQRPREEHFDDVQTILKSREIADCYARIRIFDFIGSINQTREERKQGYMRGYIELFRDGEADHEFVMAADFHRMRIGGGVEMPKTLQNGATHIQKPLGYEQTRGV
jgi:hypothetical protein